MLVFLRVIQVKVLCRSTSNYPRLKLPFYRSKGQQSKDDHRARFVCSIQSTLRALAISASQHSALLVTDTQKLLSCLGPADLNQVKLGPLRSSSAVNTKVVW